jgi:(1->4)-alpha-D-glucan 1-alpha-D-glucosylmutase
MSALRRLASALGVPPDYRDALGQIREVPSATLRAVCAALGYPAADDDAAEAALEQIEAARWTALLPPVMAWRGATGALDIPLSAPRAFGATTITWQVIAESGASHAGETHAAALPVIESGAGGERRRLTIALALPPGYHALRVHASGAVASTAEARLILAPARAYQPPELASGLWALAAQLYALRSRGDWGIGDFSALAELVACAARCGAAGVGVNPLHSLFLDDPERASPYSPGSRQFLNPLYLDVAAIEDFAECDALLLAELRARIATLRANPLVDYTAVAALKREVLALLYESFRMRHMAADDAHAQEFRAFREAGGEALRRFAVFEALRDHLGADDPPLRDWRRWPADLAQPDAAGVAAFARANETRVTFFAWLQWHADRQLARVAARAAAAAMPVGLYRDLAVGVDVAGADAWGDQEVIVGDFTVGAPPDAWAPHGQNWGFPPLNPLALRKSGHRALVDVLRANMRHAGALRIDHVLGLMRTFWIPAGASAADGAYVHNPFDELLAVVVLESHRNRCLVIGEDLGTLPEGLREALQESGLLSYRLLYFERGDGGRFLRPAEYPQQALAAITTHDLPTLVGYWQERDIAARAAVGGFADDAGPARARAERAQDRARLREALAGEALLAAPPPAAEEPPVDAAHRFLARSRASLMLVQLEDALHEPDQANLPGTDREHPNWRRRLPVTVVEAFAAAPVLSLLQAVAAERPRSAALPAAAAPRRNAWPAATYRVQLNKAATFANLQAALPYLDALGISHVYVSPFLRARPGSTHGYDIIDHNAINPEIGGDAGLERLSRALAALDMGLILDFVPNHMGVGVSAGQAENPWWLDVLQWGAASPFAGHFDIDWQAPKRELAGKVLLPVLGDHYGHVLERGELALRWEGGRWEDAAFQVCYFEHRFPIRPRHVALVIARGLAARAAPHDRLRSLAAACATLRPEGESRQRQAALWQEGRRLQAELAALARDPAVAAWLADAARSYDGRKGAPESFRALHQLLERQAYRLAFWRVASDEINYRRFFDVNDLVGLRQEVPAVFADSHRLVARLIAERKVLGLRLDHVDGLFDPPGYCRALRELVARARGGDVAPFPITVEKILAQHERLPAWPVEGTTGYEFLALVNRLFVDPEGEAAIDAAYRRFAGEAPPFERIALDCRHQIMDTLLSSELNVLARELDRISEQHWSTRDYTVERLRLALREIVASFPVYRTYVTRAGAGEDDRRHIHAAVARARRRWVGPDREMLDFIASVLTGDLVKARFSGFNHNDVLRFAMRVQQYTAPVMAKAIEDTAFYRFPRLLSLNEVGGDPQRFAVSPGAFHAANEERRRSWPHALLATATHDTKRGEDARVRLDVLSEIPEDWTQAVRRWRRFNRSRRVETDAGTAPRRVDEYLIYQALLGAWPAELTHAPVQAAPAKLRERLGAYVVKALREAKLVSSWHDPNEAYEKGCLGFLDAILGAHHPNLFLDDFQAFAARVAFLGALGSLSQVVLRCLSPGIPDTYQGAALWDLSLVDPDNRRPTDFAERARRLAAIDAPPAGLTAADPEQVATLMRDWRSGDIKLAVLHRTLALRATLPANCSYEPVATHGVHAGRVVAFARRGEGTFVLVVAGRLFAAVLRDARDYTRADWGDTALELPTDAPLTDIFTGQRHAGATSEGRLAVASVLGHLPVAVLAARA